MFAILIGWTMKSTFGSEFFAGNRQRLRELFTGTAPIVITANGLLQRAGDSTYAFKQDANFWYLTGIDEPDVLLVMDRDKEYLIVPNRSESREAFDGSISFNSLSNTSGIKRVYDYNAGWDKLNGRLRKVKHVASVAPMPAYIEQYGMFTNPARAGLIQRIKSEREDIEILDLSLHLARMRMIKQPEEIRAIQEAIDITIATMKSSLTVRKLARYKHEYEIEAELSKGFRKRGASGHAFEPIVASGERACTLHNIANNGVIAKQSLIVIDVGAEVTGYAADITRTRSSTAPSRRQQAVHAAVVEVQRYAFDVLKPGISLKEYELEIERFMGEKLRSLNLIKTIEHDAVRQYFPHATSHFLGLNVHDAGDYDRLLEPGMVLTVEPGIYIPEEGIGVRIEDDVLITAGGNKVLSNKLSRDLY